MGQRRSAVTGAAHAEAPGAAQVEPSTHFGVPNSTRSSPTSSTKDWDPHRGPCGCWRGRVRIGNEVAASRKVGEVAGPMWCSSGFDSSSDGGSGDSASTATHQAGPGHRELV
jgi:hypothetical protein